MDPWATIVQLALDEDIGKGDVTSVAILPSGLALAGQILSKEQGVLAGLEVANLAFRLTNQSVAMIPETMDGEAIEPGQVLAQLRGPGVGILSAERVALNFLQRMSGIATMTRQFVEAVKGTKAVILDTRKTAPGLRVLDKLAVRLGGGQNHRMGLYDMVLIKDNHIAAAGSISEAVRRVRAAVGDILAVEVEVTSRLQLEEALAAGVDRIMLDNMGIEEMAAAVALTDNRVDLEASGNVTLDNVAEVAATGVDFISVGSLTHSVRALDISLEITGSGWSYGGRTAGSGLVEGQGHGVGRA
ncbi:MAG: carboxylating nicotinate-nucleotide diphosphorylase [Anaerolineae bacterium]|nr:carboxylating nicotinate-nucleotide diphosphorylase [Anaerolineae bacterium]